MQHLSIDMPIVGVCDATECAYNVDSKCHARAITVGDSLRAGCDTFCSSTDHAKAAQRIAGVGACKARDCKYNEDFECVTDQIRVGHSAAAVNCLTYARR
ncbi:MAG: DUF1540 domain-containing protein [Betaproteobacteria bacterium]|nr:DUF1540 domain-containing protein [Betaproteobacteria bacterium]